MDQGSSTDADVAELVEHVRQATSAYIQGDIRRYLTLIEHAEDYTLMPPYGGEPRRGFDVAEALETTPRMFRGGEAELEVAQVLSSADLTVLVAVERQHGEVAGLPDQDWSLRVTLVFRREGEQWQLVHRHADPLVQPMTIDRMAVIARGQG
jgi:ketosteroid isomerase-like protein